MGGVRAFDIAVVFLDDVFCEGSGLLDVIHLHVE